MIRKILYKLIVLIMVANMIMIALNGLGIVKYRFNTITSYSSRLTILFVIIIFIVAIWDYKRSDDEQKDEIIEKTKPKPLMRPETSGALPKMDSNREIPNHPEHPTRPVQHIAHPAPGHIQTNTAPRIASPHRPATAIPVITSTPTAQKPPTTNSSSRAQQISVQRRRRKIQL